MSSSVFDHPWLGGLFEAPDIAPLWGADTQLAHLLAFERAFTRALAQVGRIGSKAEAEALTAIDGFQADQAGLRAGTAQDGLVVPALVRALRMGLSRPEAIHTGSTSQDVLDTATILTLKAVSQVLRRDLEGITDALRGLEESYGRTKIMGRTRMQAALPIAASTRISTWRRPLEAHIARLDEISGRLFVLQFGGAAGDNQALGTDAGAMSEIIAAELGLAAPKAPWHVTRDGVAEFGSWLSLVTGSLGKIGQDICLMAQQGVDEITLTGGGGSSAMPHKSNPVGAELLVTLARYNAAQTAALHQALVHEQERSGSAWALEWMVLPPMTMAAGCATHTALKMLDKVARIGRD